MFVDFGENSVNSSVEFELHIEFLESELYKIPKIQKASRKWLEKIKKKKVLCYVKNWKNENAIFWFYKKLKNLIIQRTKLNSSREKHIIIDVRDHNSSFANNTGAAYFLCAFWI